MRQVANWVLAAVLLASVGCGGGESKGPSLDAQVKQAMSNPAPEARVVALIRVAARQREAGDFAGAERSLGAAAEAAKTVEAPATRVETICSVIAAQDKAGSTSGAKDLLKAASRAVDEVTDPAQKAEAHGKMAVAYGVTLKDLDIAGIYLKNAEEEAAKVEKPAEKAMVWLQLAAAHSQLDDSDAATRLIEQGLQTAREIPDPRKRCDALAVAGATLSKLQRGDEAKAAFAEAQDEAAKIAEPINQSYAYLEIARQMAAAGMKSSAAEMLAKSRAAADKVEASLRQDLLEAIDRASGQL